MMQLFPCRTGWQEGRGQKFFASERLPVIRWPKELMHGIFGRVAVALFRCHLA